MASLESPQSEVSQKWTLLYDGNCGFCTSQSKRFLQMTKRNDIERIDFQQPGVVDRFPNVTEAMCERAMQLISPDDTVFSGAAAVAEAVRSRPLLRVFSWFYALPISKQLIDLGYWIIARIRYWLPGEKKCDGSGACKVEQ